MDFKRFKNPTDRVVTFTADEEYSVEPGATVAIPERISYVVQLYGLPLVPAKTQADEPPPGQSVQGKGGK